MSSGWTRAICRACWDRLNPGRTPYRVVTRVPEAEECYLCDTATVEGIFVRVKPKKGDEGE